MTEGRPKAPAAACPELPSAYPRLAAASQQLAWSHSPSAPCIAIAAVGRTMRAKPDGNKQAQATCGN